MLAPLQRHLLLLMTSLTLHPEHLLLRGLGVLSEHGFGLTSESHLLHSVTSLSQGLLVPLAGFVLGHLVLGVLLAAIVLAERLPHLRDVHHGVA